MQYHQFFVRKPSGGLREINAPDPELKELSNKLLTRLENELDRLDWWKTSGRNIYSYRPGRSCKSLVEDILSFTKDTLLYDIYYFDIKDFFPSITREMLEYAIQALNQQGCKLTDQFWGEVWKAACIGSDGCKSIAQGNPLSPAISNLVGWIHVDIPFVNNLLVDCRTPVAYFRYSDNIFLVAKRRDGYSRRQMSEDIGRFLIGKITDHLKFKAEVRSNRQENIVLGIRVGLKPQLKDKKWLRSIFYRVHTRGPAMLKDNDILREFGRLSYPKLLEIVQGLAAYVVSVDPSMEKYIADNKPMELKHAQAT